jgi:hypothetical protein
VNYTAHVFLISCLKGPLALDLQARDAGLAGLLDIGHVPTVAAVLCQAVAAQTDPAASAVRESLATAPESSPPVGKRKVDDAEVEFRKKRMTLQLRQLELENEEKEEILKKTKEATRAAKEGADRAAAEAEQVRRREQMLTLEAGLQAGARCAALAVSKVDQLRAKDELKTLMFSDARADAALGRPLCLTAELQAANLPHGTGEVSVFGKMVKDQYEILFPGQDILKKDIHVNGQVIAVNNYFEQHRPAVEAAKPFFQRWLAAKANAGRSSSSSRTK